MRKPDDRRLRFLLAGRPFFPPASGTRVDRTTRQVLFPPGAVAAELSAPDATRLLDAFPWWVPCSGRADALWAPSGTSQERVTVRRRLFDQRVAYLGDPFAWVIAAEPLRPEQVKPELDLLVNEILPLSRGEVGEAKRIALERKQARHRELSRAQVGGAWLIRVLVGGMDRRGAATVAATLCASCELDGLPYVITPAGPAMPLPDAARADLRDQHGDRAPLTAGTELLVALTRPPERELPGLRLVDPHTFDVTPENTGGTGLYLGAVLDEAGIAVDNLALDRDALNRHTFVCGATGAGKSQTVRHLLTEASRAGLPWLVVEPAKGEYSRMVGRIAAFGQDVAVIRPGAPDLPPAGFNPLEPVPGFPLQTHVDLVRALFLAAFESAEPFPQVLATALTRCYEELGWDLVLGGPAHAGHQPRYPTLGDLQRVAAAVVTDIGYGTDVAADVQGFIKVRLSSLRLGTTGRFFEGGHELDFARLRSRNVVFEIEDVGDDADKAFLMGAVLMRLSEHLRVKFRRHEGRQGLTHITVIEEAHRLLRRAEPGASGPAAHAVEMFAAMLAEVRAYGEGLIIAEQIPSKLTPDVIKNTAVKIVHRLPAQDDRDSVGATMNLDQAQSRYVVTLEPGCGAVFADRMDRPMLVRVPDGSALEKAAGTAVAPVTGLIGRRSPTCGPACLAEPCTLSQMRQAQLLLAEHQWLTLWAELTVLAHLAGHKAPVVDKTQLVTIAAAPVSAQVLECAISHAVDDAVAVRSPLLQPDVPPVGLAGHCVTFLRSAFAGGNPAELCAGDGLRYLARHYQWLTAWVALAQETGDESLHPDTATWERRFGRRIPGTNRTQQQAAVQRWWGDALADQAAGHGHLRTRRPSVIESAIGGTATDPGWDARLPDALQPFADCEWPKVHLIPVARQNTT